MTTATLAEPSGFQDAARAFLFLSAAAGRGLASSAAPVRKRVCARTVRHCDDRGRIEASGVDPIYACTATSSVQERQLRNVWSGQCWTQELLHDFVHRFRRVRRRSSGVEFKRIHQRARDTTTGR
jgi:hypothetical protein